jgi:hypothetical protein
MSNGHGFAVSRPDQHRSQDNLRWGDVKTIPTFTGANIARAIVASQSQGRQLVTAHWKWPMTWQCLFVVVPQFGPTETGEVDVDYNVTVGCGGGMITFQRRVVIPNSAISVYPTVIDDTLVLPAQDIQIDLALLSTPDSRSFTGPGALVVGAFVAPVTESHALAHMLDCMCTDQENRKAGEGWMPPGFTPTPLGYGR